MEPRRYTLVPDDTAGRDAQPASPVRRRYSLARVAPASRSALGVDRLERMEEIAALDGVPESRHTGGRGGGGAPHRPRPAP